MRLDVLTPHNRLAENVCMFDLTPRSSHAAAADLTPTCWTALIRQRCNKSQFLHPRCAGVQEIQGHCKPCTYPSDWFDWQRHASGSSP
eukprot:scaffold139203_cov28-Tisochrysis_lutea.AAC.1